MLLASSQTAFASACGGCGFSLSGGRRGGRGCGLLREGVAALRFGELARLGHLGEQRADGAGADAGHLRDLRSGHRAAALERVEHLGLVLAARRAGPRARGLVGGARGLGGARARGGGCTLCSGWTLGGEGAGLAAGRRPRGAAPTRDRAAPSRRLSASRRRSSSSLSRWFCLS